jgi:hypothetical protein
MQDGNSAWNRRHKTGHWEGKLVPFGALIDFKPSPVQLQAGALPKFSPGYHLHPGGRWKGEVLVTSLADFRAVLNGERKRAPIHIIRKIVLPIGAPFSFPLKARHERLTRTLEAPDAHTPELEEEPWDVEEAAPEGGDAEKKQDP